MLRKIYLWVPNTKYRGRIIGPGGQNISTLEYITRVDIQVREDRWIIIHENQNSDIDMAVSVVKILFKDGVINPLRIVKLCDDFKKQRDGFGLFDHLKVEEENV